MAESAFQPGSLIYFDYWLAIKLFLNVINEKIPQAFSIRKIWFSCSQALLPWKQDYANKKCLFTETDT